MKNNQIELYTNYNLKHFKQQLDELESNERPYEAAEMRAKRYQWIFFGLGLLFGLLGVIAHTKTSFTTYHLLFPNLGPLKGLLTTFCAALASAACALGLSIRPEKEAVKKLLTQAKDQLGKLYKRKRTEFGLDHQIADRDQSHKKAIFRHLYLDARDKLVERAEETLQLMRVIQQEGRLTQGKRRELYNEALLDLQGKLEASISQFFHVESP